MTLDSDDLEELLRQNLNLRRQLGIQVAKAKDGSGEPHTPIKSKLAPWLAKWSATSVQDVALSIEPFEDSPSEPMPSFQWQGGGSPRGSTAGTMTDPADDELERFRRQLTLRHSVPAEVPKAEDSNENLSAEGAVGSEEAAGLASNEEDLDELRRHLRLRRELGAETTRAKGSSAEQGHGIAYSSGWILYGICLAMAGVSAFLMWGLVGEWRFNEGILIAASISAFVFYRLGRDFLYALSGR